MITKQENELFKRWAEVRKPFSKDGVINETEYLKSEIKVLLVLKEVNSSGKKFSDLREFLRKDENKRRATWDNVARWVYGIQNINKCLCWSDLGKNFLTHEKRKQILSSIIVMNLKKSPGGHTTNDEELEKVAKQDKDFLNQQFQIYFNNEKTRPDLIICGGSSTSKKFNDIINIPNKHKRKETTKGVRFYEYETGKYFIEFAHPEARVADNLLYYGLIDAIKELRGVFAKFNIPCLSTVSGNILPQKNLKNSQK